MAKNKHRNQPPRPSSPTSPAAQASGHAPTLQVLTPEQIQEVELFADTAKEIAPEPPPAEAPPPAMSPAQAIKSAWDSERTFRAAQRDAEKARDAADLQGRELQKARAEAEQAARRQRDDLDRQQAELREKTAANDERERKLLDQDLRLTERERNAVLGFLDEQRRAVEALHAHETELRGKIAALTAEAGERRTAEEAAWRARLDERTATWHREEESRAERFRREDSDRARLAEQERGRLTDELAEAREKARIALAKEQAEHAARMLSAEQAVETAQSKLAEEQRGLSRARANVAVDREILEEDRKALEQKVVRVAGERVAELERRLSALGEQYERVQAERGRLWSDLEARRDLDRRFGDEHPEQVLGRLRQLEGEAAGLRTALRARPPESSALRLAELEKERSTWLEEQSVLRMKLAEADARAGRQRVAAIEVESLRAKTEALETNKMLLEGAVDELRAEVQKYTKADEKHNPMEALLAIDRTPAMTTPQRTSGPLGGTTGTLKDFVFDLRHRLVDAVPKRRLFYSERDVRCFLGGLAMTRLVLLQGISGTGKTSLPYAFAEAIGAGHDLIEVQAGWRDRQDLVGYYNAFHRHYYATPFLKALYTARTPAFSDRPFFIVLDEINLSRVEQFFADFLSALEQPEEKRRLMLLTDPIAEPPKLTEEGGQVLPIPPNVWFVGTANHDETTTEFADKTYDRAHVMELPRRDPTRDGFEVNAPRPRGPISYAGLMGAFSAARLTHASEVKKVLAWLGPKNPIAELLDKWFKIGWGNRLDRDVEQFVPVVVAAGGTVSEALDHLFATKVLRKLKDRHDVRPAGLDELKKTLLASWRDIGGQPERSLILIERELRAKRDEDAAA